MLEDPKIMSLKIVFKNEFKVNFSNCVTALHAVKKSNHALLSFYCFILF